jgi:hypothetical protein
LQNTPEGVWVALAPVLQPRQKQRQLANVLTALFPKHHRW